MNAFPSEDSKWNEYADGYIKVRHPGMDLRDYFAAKAMQGLLATTKEEQWIPEEVAEISYLVADAMMKAREGK